MFYDKHIDEALRLGDVVRGYVTCTPNIKKPLLSNEEARYAVDIAVPAYCAILTPCCSIGNKTVLLAPLIQVRGALFDNPYFAKDLTNINRRMEPKQTVAPEVWEHLPPEEQQRRLQEGNAFAFLESFVYERNELFPKYTLHRKAGNIDDINYYMIDFRDTSKLCCSKIVSPGDAPIESKCLQLSVQTRQELRHKISYYFATVPEEDRVLLES